MFLAACEDYCIPSSAYVQTKSNCSAKVMEEATVDLIVVAEFDPLSRIVDTLLDTDNSKSTASVSFLFPSRISQLPRVVQGSVGNRAQNRLDLLARHLQSA